MLRSLRTLLGQFLLALLVVALATPILWHANHSASGAAAGYTVARGDSLRAIAAEFGVSSEELAAVNELETTALLYRNQELTVPATATPEPAPAADTADTAAAADGPTYIVQRGDTLSYIAKLFGVPLEALAEANGLKIGWPLVRGETLVIPTGAASTAAPVAAEEAAVEATETPVAEEEAAAEPTATPVAEEEAAPEATATPAPEEEAAPEATATPVAEEEPAPGAEATSAPTEEAAPEPTETPVAEEESLPTPMGSPVGGEETHDEAADEAAAEDAGDAAAEGEAEEPAATDEAATDEAVAEEEVVLVDIVETAVTAGSFNTLVGAVQAAGLADALRGEGPFTVFAPTDDAFAALPMGALDALMLNPEGDLAQILLYHVIAGEVRAADLSDGLTLTTLQGGDVIITVDAGGAQINGVNIIVADVEASNGVIHVIDAILLPAP